MYTIEQEHTAWHAWLAADNAWQDELERVYKSKAGDARYDRKLCVATPELAQLRAAWRDAHDAYYAIKQGRENAFV